MKIWHISLLLAQDTVVISAHMLQDRQQTHIKAKKQRTLLNYLNSRQLVVMYNLEMLQLSSIKNTQSQAVKNNPNTEI